MFFCRSSSDCSGESFDSLSLSSEEIYEHGSEMSIELRQNDSETDIDDESEKCIDNDIDSNAENITTEEGSTDAEIEGVDMDVEY